MGGTAQGEAPGRESGSKGESWFFDPHSPPQHTHRCFPHFLVGWCPGSQSNLFLVFIQVVFKKQCMYGLTFVKDSVRAQKFSDDPVPSLGLLLGAKDAAGP